MLDNKEVFAKFIEETWNRRDFAAAADLLVADHAHYMPGESAPLIGFDGYRQVVEAFLRAFPDMVFTVDEVFGEGERVCLLWTARGTHLGELNGVPASNRRLELSGAGIGRVRDGKLHEIVSNFDNLSLLRQIGAFPA